MSTLRKTRQRASWRRFELLGRSERRLQHARALRAGSKLTVLLRLPHLPIQAARAKCEFWVARLCSSSVWLPVHLNTSVVRGSAAGPDRTRGEWGWVGMGDEEGALTSSASYDEFERDPLRPLRPSGPHDWKRSRSHRAGRSWRCTIDNDQRARAARVFSAEVFSARTGEGVLSESEGKRSLPSPLSGNFNFCWDQPGPLSRLAPRKVGKRRRPPVRPPRGLFPLLTQRKMDSLADLSPDHDNDQGFDLTPGGLPHDDGGGDDKTQNAKKRRNRKVSLVSTRTRSSLHLGLILLSLPSPARHVCPYAASPPLPVLS